LYAVVEREMDDGTYRPRNRRLIHKSFGKDARQLAVSNEQLAMRNEQ
jgi:hypothetical protein